VTLVEPGASRTGFGSALDLAEPLDVYADTGAGEFRRMVASGGLALWLGNPRKIAAAIIASTEQNPAPKRLTLGSDAYGMVHQALTERLATLEAQKDLAYSTDLTEAEVAKAP
jgi:hypothetical protein